MFNKLADLVQGKKQGYRPGSLLPIMSAERLLADPSLQQYFDLLKPLTAVPDDHFAHFYQTTIQRFAEYVQAIPKAYDQPLGSLLIDGLLSSINTLDFFVQEYPLATPLERFALYTACLLQEVNCIATRFKVLITTPEGITTAVWQPYDGPMTQQSKGLHYKLLPLSTTFERLDKGVRTLLARQVLGDSGFAWITSDLYILLEWLSALQEEGGEEVMRLIKTIKLYRQQGHGLLNQLSLIAIDPIVASATEYADQFYVWLAEGIADGTIKVNKADAEVHITAAGVFVEKSAIFKTFAERFKFPGAAVLMQLGHLLGVGRHGGADWQHAQLFSDYPEQTASAQRTFAGPLGRKVGMMRDGVLLNDMASLLLRDVMLPISPHIRLPGDLLLAQRALADFRANPLAGPGIKTR